jgi:hypothetical protein
MSTKMTILGNGNVGIGTINPAAKLDVIGTVKITDGTQGVGKILTSDASGNATWLTPAAGGDFMSNGSIAMTGQFLGLSGTAALPGISFSGDADNGLFRPAANQLGISTAGAERVRINASGNVGIGAPSPSTKLDIAGDLGLREINFISPGTTFNAFSTGGFSFVRLVCNFNTVINGFTGGCDGKVLVLYVNNDPGASLTINNQSASALVADRVETVTGANITVGSGLSGVITMIYNQTESRWIVTSVR